MKSTIVFLAALFSFNAYSYLPKVCKILNTSQTPHQQKIVETVCTYEKDNMVESYEDPDETPISSRGRVKAEIKIIQKLLDIGYSRDGDVFVRY